MASPSVAAPRLDALTGLRGMAAWLVVLFHARLLLTGWLPAPILDVASYGFLAVDLFFMMSGFVMWLNYGAALRDGGLRAAPRFWWRRVARIWPLHAAILTAMAGFAALLLITQRDMTGYPLAELPMHFVLVQNWGFTDALSWNHPAWSISTEMGAYLLFPFLVLAARWETMRPMALALLIIAAAGLLHLWFAMAGEPSLCGQIPRLGLVRCVIEFAIGVMLAVLWQVWHTGHAGHTGRTKLALLFAGVLVAGLMLTARLPSTFGLPLIFAAALLALALDNGPMARALGSPALRWLGDASYATYLVHFPLLIAWKLAFVDGALSLSPISFAAYCAVLLALSGGLYRWLEKPAQAALNRALPMAVKRTAKVR